MLSAVMFYSPDMTFVKFYARNVVICVLQARPNAWPKVVCISFESSDMVMEKFRSFLVARRRFGGEFLGAARSPGRSCCPLRPAARGRPRSSCQGFRHPLSCMDHTTRHVSWTREARSDLYRYMTVTQCLVAKHTWNEKVRTIWSILCTSHLVT